MTDDRQQTQHDGIVQIVSQCNCVSKVYVINTFFPNEIYYLYMTDKDKVGVRA